MPTSCTPWLRPLLALDSADGAAAAWAIASERAGGRCAVVVLHTVTRTPAAAWCAVTPGCPTMTLPLEDPEAHADAQLRRIAAQLPGDVSVTTLACQGRRADQIARWARQFCADGVVVACGGGRLVRRVRRRLGGVEVVAA